MSNSTKTIIIGLIFVLFMCVASYFAGRVKGREIGWKAGYSEGYADGFVAPHPADTTTTTDTTFHDHPEPTPAPAATDSRREALLLGTIAELRAMVDSLQAVKPDTAFVEVPVPRDTLHYGGQRGDDYEAQVSGYRPSLDWIKTYPQTTTITQYVDRPVPQVKRWGFSITAGPSVLVTPTGEVRGGLGATAGISYTF